MEEFFGWQFCRTEKNMAWKKPTVTEISLGCEINSYACAEVRR